MLKSVQAIFRFTRVVFVRCLVVVNTLVLCFLCVEKLNAQVFTPGNLAVLKVGDGTGLTSAAQPISVVEFSTSGVASGVNIVLPSTGASPRITNSGTATSEGQMVMSAERDRLILVGYDANAGTAGVVSSSSATVKRQMFEITPSATYSLAASTNTLYSGNNIRSGTASGASYFGGGPGSGSTLFGGSIMLTSPAINTRVIQIFNGQTYISSATGSNLGVLSLGTNIPTTCCQTTTLLNASPSPSAYGFSFSPDGNTLYIADDAQGINKYTKSGSTYTLAYNLNSTMVRSIAVDYSGVTPVVYATTASSITPNQIIKITDAGMGPASTVLVAASPANTVFRSISFVPSCMASISLLSSASVCVGSTATFVIKGNPTGIVSYNINGGATLTTTINARGYDTLSVGPLTGNTTINLLSISTQACVAAPVTGSVSVNVFPAFLVTSTSHDGPLCAGNDLHLGASISSSAGPYTYVWSGPVGIVSSLAPTGSLTSSVTVSAIPTLPAYPMYSLAVTDAAGCAAYATIATTVNPRPVSYTVFGTGSYCAGGSGVDVQLSNSETGVNYQLYNASGTVGTAMAGSTGTPLDFGMQPAGVYTISAINPTTGCRNNMIGFASITMNPLPAIITGNIPVCVSSSIQLTDASGGGTWSSGSISLATLGSSTGIATGVSAGNPLVTYTLPTGCYITTTLTVNPLPLPISGGGSVCLTSTISLSDGTGGGAWYSGNTAVATVVSGLISPISAGTTTISYVLATGCMANRIITVYPLPATITGSMNVCVGLTTALSDGGGGTWISGSLPVGTIDAVTGVLTGVSAGITLVTYTLPTGCQTATSVTVNALPLNITGVRNVCVGYTTNLTDVTPGGTWSSESTSIATIGSLTGLVSGMLAGTTNLTYTLLSTGCYVNATFTVNPLPEIISGPGNVCAGSLTPYTDVSGGGAWISSNTGVASIGSVNGLLSAIMAGTTTLTYTIGTGCQITKIVSVNPLPAAITGVGHVCEGLTTSFSDITPLGNWISGTPLKATIDGTGNVTGILSGTVNITYQLPTGCYTTTTLTVNPLPGSINGPTNICAGSSVMLTDAATGGTWVSSNPGFISVNFVSGLMSAIMGGSSTITYTLPTGCLETLSVTVNPLPPAITGSLPVCVGGSFSLTDAMGGGTWSSSNTSLATVEPGTGLVTGMGGGSPVITYRLPTSCYTTTVVTINGLPSLITGNTGICLGATSLLVGTPTGGTWTSSIPATASIEIGTGLVGAIASGTTSITYTLATGCYRTAEVTVNPLAPGITGSAIVCPGATTNLSDIISGGTWSSTAISVATVGSSTGIVTGVTAGVAAISYLPASGCGNYIMVTVSPLPAAISGNRSLCLGSTTNLSDATAGGIWSSSDVSIATIVSTTGDVTGLTLGTAIISYLLPTGCFITSTVTVNPLPAGISGTASVCVGSTMSLSDLPGGGTWSTSSAGIFVVTSLSGIVTGVSAGTAVVTYSLNTGCIATRMVTVEPLPGTISGTRVVCLGLTTVLSDVNTGGTWTTAAPAIASIDPATGVVTGNIVGTSIISYTLPTGCSISAVVTVSPLPLPIAWNVPVCVGTSINLSDVGGGSWSSTDPEIAVVTSGGTVFGISEGFATISYTLPTGCVTTAIVTVNALPPAISGPSNVCIGMTIALSDPSPAGYWRSGNTGVATTDSASGIVTGITSGSVVITYILLATGCSAAKTVTVVPMPGPITGPDVVCVEAAVSLAPPVPGGTWSCTDVSATISSIGNVTGVLAGTARITYTVPAGCLTIKVVTVNPIPVAITGVASVCAGLTTTLSDLTTGGTWSSSSVSTATISSAGVVSAIAAGTSVISYRLPTGCGKGFVVTVNPLPNAIAGSLSTCVGATSSLSDISPGGLWSIDPLAVTTAAVIPETGSVTGLSAGNAGITYTLPTGCSVVAVLTVNPIPLTITGIASVCIGATSVLSDVTTGGIWSSSNPSLAFIGSLSGIVTAITDGTVVISYKIPSGCYTTLPFIVNPLPAPISGNRSVCIGATSLLSDASVGGVWSVGGASVIATVGSATGVVSGISYGTAMVTYTLSTGCIARTTITVNPYPAAIAGDTEAVCQGFNILLTNSTPAGVWSSADPGIAAVVPGTGLVNGVSAGTASISYTLPTGCGVTSIVTVNPLFPVSGSRNVCAGSVTVLSDLVSGGTWTSSNSSVGTVGSVSGSVTGIGSGTTFISYHLSTGCTAVAAVTVNPVPANFNVTGGGTICVGAPGVSIGLDGSATGIYYELFKGFAPVDTLLGSGTAVDFGTFTTAGVYTVLAIDQATGCPADMTGSAVLTVSPIVVPSVAIVVNPGLTVCEGSLTYYRAIATNGGATPSFLWSVNGASVGSGDTYSYVPLNGDSVFVKLVSSAACASTDSAIAEVVLTTVTGVLPSVSISVSPGDSLCPGTPVTITPTAIFGGSAPVYNWMKNGIYAGSGSNYTFLPMNGDNIFCVMHSSHTCILADSVHSNNNINMNVPPISVPIVSISAYPSTVIVAGQTDTLVANVIFPGLSLSYQWMINGIPVPGANSDTFISNTFNKHDVVACVVTGMSVCGSAERSAEVVIADSFALSVADLKTSLDDVRLVPNPNNGTFAIKGKLTGVSEVSVVITDMLGQKIYGKVVSVRNGDINDDVKLSNIANGMYLLTLISPDASKVIHFSVGQ